MDKEKTSGQIISRPSGVKTRDGKSVLVMVYGILSVPADSPLNKEGMQFIVSDNPLAEQSPNIELTVHRQGAIDQSAKTIGNTPSHMFMEPIWRV